VSTVGLPDSFFTASPRWEWLIIGYFFVGGIAGGAYFIAALIDFFGRWEDRPLARLGYYIAFPAISIGGVLLILDLSRPLRFWHMLLESHTWHPMFKWWSPMSIGSWALLAFGLFSGVSFLAALADVKRPSWRWPERFRAPHALGIVWTTIGGLLGFFVAGYTGVLLSVTNRPVWTQTPLLGMVFVLSGASTAAALIMLLAMTARRRPPGLQSLSHFDSWLLGAELIALIALLITVGAATFRHVWLSWWGLLLLLGVFVIGIILPLVLELRRTSGFAITVAAVLVLIGGFMLRVVILLAPDTVQRAAALLLGRLT
jgi:protein NrfD